MDHKYRAFISYRHSEQDIAAATHIQRALEHYPVPRQVWLKTGRKKIGRIFRDKEELSVTKDLNETIEQALNSAEFLIVICSPETKQSKWVLKEIEFFLRTHSRDKVLTVLVSGEPMEVIPEVLLTGQDNVQYEPLSCDFRSKSRSVRKTELTRMAAVLLGCSYDELAMRERQYRRRRMRFMLAGVLAVLSVALVYLLWSRQAIRKNYDIALNNYEVAQQNLRRAKLNQSSALAEYANALLKDGDRLRATLLCLEALPSTMDQRPFSPAAFNTLAKAVGAYIPRGRRTGTSEMVTTAEFSAQSRITGFGLSDSSRYLYVYDGDGNIYVWDLSNNNKKVFEIYQPSSSLRNVFFLPDERLAVCASDKILIYGMDSSEPALTIDNALLKDQKQKAVCDAEGMIVMSVVEGSWEDETQRMRLLEFDSRTGELLSDSDLGAVHESDIQGMYVSPGGKYAVIVYFDSSTYLYRALLYDRTQKISREILTDESLEEINSIRFTDEEHLAVLHSPNDGETSSVYDSSRVLWKEDVCLELLDLQGWYRRWISTFCSVSFNHVPEDKELFLCDTLDENGEPRAAILAVHANTAALFDLATGKLLNENETSSTIIMVRREENGTFELLLESGDVGIFDPTNPGMIREEACYTFGIIQAKEGPRGSLLIQPTQSTLWLSTFAWDDTFTRLSDMPLPSTELAGSAVIGETLVIMDMNQTILQYDLANGGKARKISPAGEEDFLQWVGCDTAGLWLTKYNLEGGTASLLRIDASDGSIKEFQDARCNEPGYFSTENNLLCIQKEGYYALYSEQDGALKEEFLLDLGDSHTWIYPDAKHNRAILVEMEPEGEVMTGVYLYDVRSGTRRQLEFPMRGAVTSVCWNTKGTEFLLDYTYGLFLMDGTGTLISHIEETGQESTAKYFLDDSLLVLFTGGHLNRYSTKDGHLISQTALTYRKDDFLLSEMRWIPTENSLVLQPGPGVLPPLYILETEGFEEIGYSRYAIGYDAARNRILSYETDPQSGESYVGYFSQHTVYSLRDKTRRVLDGMRLTDEERSRYALD